MAKFILLDSNDRVLYVEDSRPTIAGAEDWIEVSNDSVASNWYYDRETSTLSQYKPLDIFEVRKMRDEKLTACDWMVLEDSPYQASDQSSNLATIKTYRQQLRDFPDESATYNENNINWPTLTLS